VPDKVSTAPPVAVTRLADQLSVDPSGLRSYGRRAMEHDSPTLLFRPGV
jgi:hypothetical protein